MKVAIVGINYSPELTGIAVYTTGMAEYLQSNGFDVTVYTGFPYYPIWAKQETDRRRWRRDESCNGVNVRRSYLFVPKSPSPVKRILHELSFVLSASINYLRGPRAAVTIILSPPLLLGVCIALLAKLKRSKTIFHVQDLQPDAAVDMGMLRRGTLTSTLYYFERLTYRLVDRVSTISTAMIRKIHEKGVDSDKTFLFKNWAHDHFIVPLSSMTEYRRELSLTDKQVVLYAGNMGVKQGLHTLIAAAGLLRDQSNIVFLLVGDGGQKSHLQSQAEELKLKNIQFLPLQPFDRLSELLATADVTVLPQINAVNDNMLPSKLPNIMASQRPVVVSAPVESELARIIRDAQCGLRVEPEHPEQLADAIKQLLTQSERRDEMAISGRKYMESHFSQHIILSDFADTIRSI